MKTTHTQRSVGVAYLVKFLAFVIAGMIGTNIATADTIYWSKTATGTSWNEDSNWDAGAKPQTGDDVWITVAGHATRANKALVVMDDYSATINALYIGQQAATSGTLILQGTSSMVTTAVTAIARHGEGTLILKDNAQWKHTVGNFGVLINGAGTGCLTLTGSSEMSLNATGNNLNNFVTGENASGGVIRVLFEEDSRFSMTVNGNNTNRFYVIYGGGDSLVEIKDRAVVTSAVAAQYAQNATRTGTATLTLTGTTDGERGTMIVPQIYFIGGAAADYTLDFNGGVLKAAASTNNFIGNDGTTSAAQLKIITRGDGAFIDSNGFDIGIADSARYTFTGTSGLTKLGAGTLTLNNTIGYTGTTAVNEGVLVLGIANQLATGAAVTIAGTGTLSSANLDQTLNNLSGAGAVNLGSGAITIASTADTSHTGNLTVGAITKNGAGKLTLSGNNAVSGDITLNGGVLAIASASAIGSGAGQTLAINSGTFANENASALTLAHDITLAASTRFAINSGSAKLELTGAITGDSGILKTGTGTLILSGNTSGITGAVNVNEGGLFMRDVNTSGVTVAAGGAFGGAGTITGDLSYLGDGILQLGYTHNDATVTTSSTLTITGNLDFAGTATVRIDMYEHEVDSLVANNATFAGATNTIDLVNIQTGTFTLFKLNSGTFADSFIASLGTTQDGGGELSVRASASYQLNDAKNELQLISGKTNHVVTWTGTTDANWDSAAENWKGGDTAFLNGDKVVFDSADTTGNRNIDIMDTGATASELNITGDGSYTFTGGAITVDKASLGTKGGSFGSDTPTGVFTINTSGTVTLANDEANVFTAGITLQQGTLIGNADTLGNNTNISNNGKVVFDQATAAIFTGTLTGAGDLGKTGDGMLILTADNSGFTGAVTLSGGVLRIDDNAKLGSATVTGSNSGLYLLENAALAGSVAIENGYVTLGTNALINNAVTLSGTGDIYLYENAVINGAASTGTGHIILGVSGTINGAAATTIGGIQLGENSFIGGAATTGSGNILLAENAVIGGGASTGTGSIQLQDNARINGNASTVLGDIILGASSTISGAATTIIGGVQLGENSFITGTVTTGVGHILLAENAAIGGASTGAGSIRLQNNASINGNASAIVGHIILGEGSSIAGTVTTGSGDIALSANAYIGGAATTAGGSIDVGANGIIDGNVGGTGTLTLSDSGTITGSVVMQGSRPYIILGTNSRIVGTATMTGHNTLYLEGGAKMEDSFYAYGFSEVILRPDSEIAGDVTFRVGGEIMGSGTISGDVRTEATTNNMSIYIGVPNPSNILGIPQTSATATLHIKSITMSGSNLIYGSGTLATAFVSFADTLTVQNPGADLHITGSLIGTGSLTKTGMGTVVLDAPSGYTGATTVAAGTLKSAVEGALSSNSAFTVAEGATLHLNGYNQTLASLVNNGSVRISADGALAAGTKLKVTGPYSGNLGGMTFNIVTDDTAKTLSDQLILGNAALASGTTKIFIQPTDNRADTGAVLYDIDPLVIAESGEIAPGTFILDDGNGFQRALIGKHDYILEYDKDRVELVAAAAAELPAALAANAVSIMANRAALGSISQRLDYLRAASALPGSEDIGIQAWAQTYYRADDLDSKIFPNSDGDAWGVQAGIDKRTDKAGDAYTTYGAFIDRTEASATLPNKTSTDLSSTGIGGYISMHTIGNWHVDAVARYTWDKYKINVGRRSMSPGGFTWGAMLRIAKVYDLGRQWELTPQIQAVYQNRKVDDMTDSAGRHYVFGPDHMSISDPSSFESRAGMGLRKVIVINDTVSLAPYVSAHFLYEFRGNLAVHSVNNTGVSEDFGGDSYLFTIGVPVRLGKHVDIYVDGSLQTSGPITGHGLNLGINYRW